MTKKTSRTNSALEKNLASLNTKSKQSKATSKKKTSAKQPKKTGTTSGTTPKAKAKTSTKITIVQSRKKDLFPHMGVHKYPYRFEPMPEIQDRLNLAWFDEHYGDERMKDHIRKHKLKSHQYKCYVNYWWLKEKSNAK